MHSNAYPPLPQPMAVSYSLHFPQTFSFFCHHMADWLSQIFKRKYEATSQVFCNILTPFCSFLKHFPHLPKWLSLSTFWSSSHFLCFLWEFLLLSKPLNLESAKILSWTPFSASSSSRNLPTYVVSYRVRMPQISISRSNLCFKFLRALQINHLALTSMGRFHIASVSADPEQTWSISSQHTNSSSLSCSSHKMPPL